MIYRVINSRFLAITLRQEVPPGMTGALPAACFRKEKNSRYALDQMPVPVSAAAGQDAAGAFDQGLVDHLAVHDLDGDAGFTLHDPARPFELVH